MVCLGVGCAWEGSLCNKTSGKDPTFGLNSVAKCLILLLYAYTIAECRCIDFKSANVVIFGGIPLRLQKGLY